jgi:hypothetical protein
MDAIRVLSQRQTEKVLDDGEVHTVVSIGMLIGRSGPFTLDVPIDQYHHEEVVAMARELEYRQGSVRYFLETLHEREGGQSPGQSPAPPPSPPPADRKPPPPSPPPAV